MAKSIGVVLRRETPGALELLLETRRCAPAARFLVAAGDEQGAVPSELELVDPVTFEAESDIVLVLGGDGTLIHAASLLPNRLVPILGVNLGRIGFLTDVTRDELAGVFARALEGSLSFSDRMRLDAEARRGNELLVRGRVLNDAVVSQLGLARLPTYRISIGGKLVTNLRADGVIVATPTGSTAYSMSAGGSILTPGLQGIAITPICPHAVTQRPLVVEPEGTVEVAVESGSAVFVSLDGQAGSALKGGDVVSVRRAAVGTRIFSLPEHDYFLTLRTKLRWGDG